MIPKKPAPDVILGGYRFSACAKPRQPLAVSFNASAGEARWEKIMCSNIGRNCPQPLLLIFVSWSPPRRIGPSLRSTISAMTVGFAAKAAIVLAYRFGWRCSRIALDRNPSSLAIGQNISLRLVVSAWNFLPVAARAMESAVQFFCALVRLVDAPGVIRRFAAFRPLSRLLRRVWMRSVPERFTPVRFIVPRLARHWRARRREIGLGQPY